MLEFFVALNGTTVQLHNRKVFDAVVRYIRDVEKGVKRDEHWFRTVDGFLYLTPGAVQGGFVFIRGADSALLEDEIDQPVGAAEAGNAGAFTGGAA